MNDEIAALRRDVDGLIRERDVLLGFIAGLRNAMAAVMQTYPDQDGLRLAIHRLLDAREAGLITAGALHGAAATAEQQMIDGLLAIDHAPPYLWRPRD